MAKPSEAGMDALHRLKSTEAPVWLAPSPSLAQAARTALLQLFSTLKPHVPKSPFDRLLVDGFDAEQIWQQIDLLQVPLLASIRHQVKHWERNTEELRTALKKNNEKLVEGDNKGVEEEEAKRVEEDVDMDAFDDNDEEEEEEEQEQEEQEDEKEGGENGIEDKFLKIKELEEYLEDDEAREYGLDTVKKKQGEHMDEEEDEDDDDEEEEEEGDEDVEDDELGTFDDGEDEDEDVDTLGNARYEDFFGSKKKSISKKRLREDSESDDKQDDDSAAKKRGGLSRHEKQLEKLRSEIEQMEKANLEPKTWTMQGEVTAASRPKNSALEVDLDFEHNARPAPVITDEVTASLEDMIKSRIVEGRFDDIQKAPSLPSKAPRELKELDENKSKKGLAEVYEEEYLQKTNPAAAPLSFSDEQKKEASMLFKKLCLKLDALSHFNFAPKPVIEDMSIQTNVPALAMEEIAPVAVSDAAMLAPEEIFSGKGDIKDETELTQVERKRRRAKKKRKFKAEAAKRMVKKAKDTTSPNQNDVAGKED